MVKIEIGVSCLCYAPWSSLFPALFSRWAKEDGFAGLQMMPLKFQRPSTRLALPIWTWEGVWYEKSRHLVLDFIRARLLRQIQPRWLELALFPLSDRQRRRLEASFSPAIQIEHGLDADADCCLEVNPGMWKTVAEIEQQWPSPRRFVIDLYHLRHEPFQDHRHQDDRPDGVDPHANLLGDWLELINRLAHRTAVVHIQPYRAKGADGTPGYREIDDFLVGPGTQMETMLRHLARLVPKDVRWIIEIAPFSVRPAVNREQLRLFRQRVEQVLQEELT